MRDKYSPNWKNASRRFVISTRLGIDFFFARRHRAMRKSAKEILKRDERDKTAVMRGGVPSEKVIPQQSRA